MINLELRTGQQSDLLRATQQVSALFINEQVGALFGNPQRKRLREMIWAEVICEFPAFADTIRRLEMITEATKPGETANISDSSFSQVADSMARKYLNCIYFSRVNDRLNGNPGDTKSSIAGELGIRGDWDSDEARKVVLEDVVGATLAGKLRV